MLIGSLQLKLRNRLQAPAIMSASHQHSRALLLQQRQQQPQAGLVPQELQQMMVPAWMQLMPAGLASSGAARYCQAASCRA